jgi:hypothetical protein
MVINMDLENFERFANVSFVTRNEDVSWLAHFKYSFDAVIVGQSLNGFNLCTCIDMM